MFQTSLSLLLILQYLIQHAFVWGIGGFGGGVFRLQGEN